MGDHFVLLVDRLLTESSLAAAIESKNSAAPANLSHPKEMDSCVGGITVSKLVECRICQDEDEDSNMETPCSCCGSLKYAHRKCVQRWCNEKGDIVCEICLQQFKPGYTAPSRLSGYVPMDFRASWELSRRDMFNHPSITMFAADHGQGQQSVYDEGSVSNARSTIYCRLVATIFMVLLVLRHILPVILDDNGSYSPTLFTLVLLRTAGIVLPLYIMLRTVTTFHRHRRRRRQQQESQEASVSEMERESSPPPAQPQQQPVRMPAHLVHAQ